MESAFPSKPLFWDSWATAVLHDAPALAGAASLLLPTTPAEVVEQLYAAETLYPRWLARRPNPGAEPYTLQWFLNIENQRYGRQGRWVPKLLEFAKHSGETLLGLGGGLGTDWLQYARHGAGVVVCSSSAEQLALVRRNFELRGLRGRFLHATPAALPLESSSIDVVCASNLPAEEGGFPAVVQEIYRVLKPGGKVLAVAPAKYDLSFWSRRLLPWRPWFPPTPPPAAGYSARRLRKQFSRFVEHRIHKRQLRRGEVPHVWRWLPLPLLERLTGHCLVLKAFKPLSAAILSLQLAA